MKLTKKKVFVVAVALCLVAIISMGTLAWFSDSDSVTNDFLIADSEHDSADEIFSIDVYETTPDGTGEQIGYEYEDILPGDTLTKDVFVKNTGYYDQYVRVIITLSDAEAWDDVAFNDFADVFVNLDAIAWEDVSVEKIGAPGQEKYVFVLYYPEIMEENDVINVFDAIKIPESLDREEAEAFGNAFSVTVKAQAVQTKNVGAETPAVDNGVQRGAAWTAFNTVGLSIEG